MALGYLQRGAAYTCPTCKGEGWVVCPLCSGATKYVDRTGRTVKCPNFHDVSHGLKIQCPTCKGKGVV